MMKTRKRITNNQKSNLNSQRLIGYVLIWIGLVRYPDKQPIHPRWKTSKRMTHRSSALGKTPSGNRRLQYLLQQRRNRTCDDCGAPDPKWASANIGVFICLKRCGVHRCLGVHISKVLPMTLDSWSDVEIDAMIEVGENASANSIYEAYIPQGISKPRPDATQKDCSKFIRWTILPLSSKTCLFEHMKDMLRPFFNCCYMILHCGSYPCSEHLFVSPASPKLYSNCHSSP
ncbi:unnamed protein product [Lactuca virosa]|uniref:Arf-GAP domain-containing protein n=1 Tax=Lactuca virosa TaxID=75947 RepID=A0AAU9PJK9_9ASTR|nr:unnamed protein product [Lactuca virosa]